MSNLSRVAIFLSFISLVFSSQVVDISGVEKIDINTAPLEDLIKIIHIGEVRAKELISLRPFSSLDELTKIKGIGEARLEDIKKQGLAWAVEQSQAEPDKSIVEDQPQRTYSTGIVISEILPSPEGPDAENEWIEILNKNSSEVDLSGWQIADTVGKTTTYTFPVGTKILPQGFLVLSRPESKITLNNDEDGLLFIQPNGNILDSVKYKKAPRGQSFNRIGLDWAWSSILTAGSENILPQPEIKKEVEKKSETETQKPEVSPEIKRQLASVREQALKSSKSLFVFLIASGLAIFSGTMILILKKKVKNLDLLKKLE